MTVCGLGLQLRAVGINRVEKLFILAPLLHMRHNARMILPEIKRVVRFDEMAGKTIQSVEERMGTVRFIFTDGRFADLEPDTSAKIIVQRARASRREKREWRESRG